MSVNEEEERKKWPKADRKGAVLVGCAAVLEGCLVKKHVKCQLVPTLAQISISIFHYKKMQELQRPDPSQIPCKRLDCNGFATDGCLSNYFVANKYFATDIRIRCKFATEWPSQIPCKLIYPNLIYVKVKN